MTYVFMARMCVALPGSLSFSSSKVIIIVASLKAAECLSEARILMKEKIWIIEIRFVQYEIIFCILTLPPDHEFQKMYTYPSKYNLDLP